MPPPGQDRSATMRRMDPGERLAGRALAFASVACLVVPALVVTIAVLPQGARRIAFLLGLAVVASLGMVSGVAGRRALLQGTRHRWRAVVGSWLGFTVGITAGAFAVWSSLGALVA